MDIPALLDARNADFAASDFDPGLKMMPSARTLVLGCVDPRVDPMAVLKLRHGEAAVIRNVGGRVNPALFGTLAILCAVSRAAGKPVGEGWNLMVLHHTDCGIVGCHAHAPHLIADYMGVPADALDGLGIDDPDKAVAVDIAALKAHPALPAALTVTGLVYDVATGRTRTVVPPAPLRPAD